MQTWVTINGDGSLIASTNTWDTSGWGFLTGFHGAVVIRFYDIDKNPILPDIGAGPYGVEGGQTRQDSWSATVTQQQLDTSCWISVCNFYDPQYSAPGAIWGWVSANQATILAIAKGVAELAA